MIGTAAASRSSDLAFRRRLLLVPVVAALIAGVGPMVLQPATETVKVQFGDRSAWIDKSEVSDLLATRSALLEHAPAGGSLFVGATDMSRDSLTRVLVYHLVPELHARGYFLDLTGGVAARSGSGLVNDLRRSNVLLLTRLQAGLMERISPYAQPGSKEANQMVASEFCLVGETGWGEVYQRMPCTGRGFSLPQKVGVPSPSPAGT